VLKFADTLRPRDLANYDPEDVLTELYLALLLEKDHKWEPERGKYLTFAGTKVVENELHAIRDRSHTVHSPRNSSCRLKQYEPAQVGGTLSGRKAKTFADIRRVIGEHEPWSATPDPVSVPDTADVVERREDLKARQLRRPVRPDGAGAGRGDDARPGLRAVGPARRAARRHRLPPRQVLDSVKKTKGRAAGQDPRPADRPPPPRRQGRLNLEPPGSYSEVRP
jgi:hypothetical protein